MLKIKKDDKFFEVDVHLMEELRAEYKTHGAFGETETHQPSELQLRAANAIQALAIKRQLTIGVACDGFRLTVGEDSVFVNQEDDAGEKLKPFFEKIGFEVCIDEDF